VQVFIDGLAEEVRNGATVLEILQNRGEPTSHVLVEINGSFVHPNDYAARTLRVGDRLEVVYPAFGG
jgi:thiamine biosynthesis protein ThiS